MRLADDFHPRRRLLDEGIERQHGKHGADRTRRAHAVQMKQLAEHRGMRDRVARKVRVADHEFVAVTH